MAQPDVYTRTTYLLFTLIYFSTGLAIIRLCPMILLDKSTWDGHTIVGVIGSTSRLETEMEKWDYVRGGVGGLGGLWGGMMGGVRVVLLNLGETFSGLHV